MAGSGIALRLHEFKETASPCMTVPPSRVTRQGRDALGIYPGQLARVHVTRSTNHRLLIMPTCTTISHDAPACRMRCARQQQLSEPLQEEAEGDSMGGFDLWTLHALQQYRYTHDSPTQHNPLTTQQEAERPLSHLYTTENRKITPNSLPGPLRQRLNPPAQRSELLHRDAAEGSYLW
ncbi:hypothetical protein AGOR_G00100730 [Albula goreensis]|uniref:Uncharacterized protein n=1 Tax=Albula goreensis TaxID=1534307 RepID=A0A8T3DIA2_9TELE|nr:hypothetical protein AGOR_G00100730 [Albula goreensis]